jgi:phage recombination protein Bet
MSDMIILDEQVDLIKKTIAKGASDTELSMFLQQCQRLRLDPFSRQIFLVPRYDSSVRAMVRTPQVSIDGMRLIAQRTGKYRGQTPVEWCAKDGVWADVWLDDNQPPAAARVGVRHSDFDEPLYAVARYGAYVQTRKDGKANAMWARMPDLMLGKVAESLALRKAFPHELSGVYTTDEMGQAKVQTPVKAESKPKQLTEAVGAIEAEIVKPSPPPAQATERLAETLMHMIRACKNLDDLEAIGEKIAERKNEMTEDETIATRVVYGTTKAKLVAKALGGKITQESVKDAK